MYNRKVNLYCVVNTQTSSSENSKSIQEKRYVPLKRCKFIPIVNSHFVEHKIILEYLNESPETIEAFFVFPLHPEASVHNFTATIGDRVIKCTLKEKEQAKQEYQEAVDSGKKAVIMNKEGNDLFSCQIGNLAPSQSATIIISLCHELDQNGNCNNARLLMPLSITPRFMSNQYPNDNNNKNNTSKPLSSFSRDPHVANSPYEIEVSGKIAMSCNQIEITTLTDKSSCTLSNMTNNSCDFEINNIESGKDIVLLIKKSEEYSSFLSEKQVETSLSEFSYVHCLNVIPTTAPSCDPKESEYTIIVDRSGSMSTNNRIGKMKKAMEIILHILTNDSGISIYNFDDKFEKFNHRDKIMTDDYRKAAISWINNINERGGTEVIPVLQEAITNLGLSERVSKNIILMTDGDVGNDKPMIKVAKLAEKLGIRIFILGIGDACSKEILIKTSKITRGITEFVKDDESLMIKLTEMINKTRTLPTKTDIKVVTEGNYNIVNMEEMTYLYNDCNNMFYLTSTERIDCINICGQDIIPQQVDQGLIKIVGKKILDSLTDKAKIIETSLATGVLCEYTSFIGVEEVTEEIKEIEGEENEKPKFTPKKVLIPLHSAISNNGYNEYYDDEELEGCVEECSFTSYSQPTTRAMMFSKIKPLSNSSAKYNNMNESMASIPKGGAKKSLKKSNNSQVSCVMYEQSRDLVNDLRLDLGKINNSKDLIIDELTYSEERPGNDIVEMKLRSPRSPRSDDELNTSPRSSPRSASPRNSNSPRSPIFGAWTQRVKSAWSSISNIGSSKSGNTKLENKASETTFSVKEPSKFEVYTVSLVIDTLDTFTFEIVGDCYLSKVVGPFSDTIILKPNDYIRVNQGKHQGYYKIICAGSSKDCWIIEKCK